MDKSEIKKKKKRKIHSHENTISKKKSFILCKHHLQQTTIPYNKIYIHKCMHWSIDGLYFDSFFHLKFDEKIENK